MISAPIRIAMPDTPEPTSYGLTQGFYIRAGDICKKVLESYGKKVDSMKGIMDEPSPHDVPGDWFRGPF